MITFKDIQTKITSSLSGMYAATYTFEPLTDIKSSPLLTNILGSGDFASFIQNGFKAAIALGAIAAVLRIAYGGLLYMTSTIPGNKTAAIKIIQDAVIGLLLLLGMVVILQQINPDILDLSITGL